ncbi:hypothetical protein [Cytobacillus sp. FSL K6-0265]
MVTVFAVTYAFSAPLFFWLSDKKGRRTFIMFGLLPLTCLHFPDSTPN